MNDKGKIVCFGELLLRLNAPGHERLLQTNALRVHVGGAEANVAAALAQFGADAEVVAVTPDNALGDAAVRALRGVGVETRNCRRGEGRMGLYFMTSGAVLRPSEILYDRAHSAFARAAPDAIDWNGILGGASWLHLSGVTPAVSASSAGAALTAVRAAAQYGVKISFDGNYRAQLWAARAGDAPAILKQILDLATIAFIDRRDVALILGGSFDGAPAAMRKAAFDAFPKLEMIASTFRAQSGANDHALSASIATREKTYRSREIHMPNVVDRIGGGDAFAAGVLFTLWDGGDLQRAVDFGLAASVLKHSMPGDMLVASRRDVEAQMREDGFDVRR